MYRRIHIEPWISFRSMKERRRRSKGACSWQEGREPDIRLGSRMKEGDRPPDVGVGINTSPRFRERGRTQSLGQKESRMGRERSRTASCEIVGPNWACSRARDDSQKHKKHLSLDCKTHRERRKSQSRGGRRRQRDNWWRGE